MPRIVSLIASATEIVSALGFEDQLVGRSHECDYPASTLQLPVCTEPKFSVAGKSADIDRHVKNIVREGLSVYRVHADALRELRPDVIVTQSHCEVCAVSERDVEEAACQWLGSEPRIVSLAPYDLDDVWQDISLVAQALGVPERGIELVSRLQERMETIADRARALSDRPTVGCIEWIEPLMAAGNWMPALVDKAGGTNLLGAPGKHSPWLCWEQLQALDPEAIVVLPCGFDRERTRREMPPLLGKPGWEELRAVHDRRVFLTDGNQYFNRPGPRLAESLEILAEILHPEEFHFGHEGEGWERL